jgi:proline iminopeptidase
MLNMKRTTRALAPQQRGLRAIAAAGIAVLALIAGGLVWYIIGQPLYEPGMVRAGRNLRAPLTPPTQPADGQFWKVEDDIQLHHFAAGAGRNVLVIHGGPGYPYTQPWAGLEPLTQRYTFHYYDQRGSGQSSRPIDRFSSQNYSENLTALDRALGLGAQIADVERIRQILGEDRLILVGHSFGGFLASLYAAEFPDHVQALILVAPADTLVMPPSSGGFFEQVRQRLPEDRRVDYDAYLKRYLDFQNIFSKSEAELIALNEEFGQYYAAIAPAPLPEPGQAGGWMVQALYFSMGQRHDYRAALNAVSAPVLVLHGANDLQPEQASRLYAESFPNARFVVIVNASHFPFEEQPEAFAATVSEFLDDNP